MPDVSLPYAFNRLTHCGRPAFVAEVQQGDQSAIFYCGWDAGLTSYRLLVAIFSLILSPALPWLITKRRVLFWLLLCLSITWICVLSIDIVALNAGRTVCRRGKESFPDYYNCHNDVYGATIAHDLMMCLSVFLTWVVLCPTNGKVLLTEQPAEEYVTCSGNHH